jgi:hypothetical protein
MVNRGGIEWDDPEQSLLLIEWDDPGQSLLLADLFIFEFFRNGYIFYNGLDQRGYKASWN